MQFYATPRRAPSSAVRDRPVGMKDALYYRLKAIIDRAIRENITAPDWTTNLQFVALVNKYIDADASSRAMMLILRRMLGGRSGWRRSNRVSWLVLLLLETCMKNCGPKFHFAAADDRLFQLMLRLAKPRITGKRSWGSNKGSGNFNRDLMEERVLVLIQSWGKAFGSATRGRMAIYNYYYQKLLAQGVKFPASKPEDEVFAPHEVHSKSSSRERPPSSKAKKPMDSTKLKETLAPMKEAVTLLQEMLDALEPSENPDKDSVILGLVDQLRQAKPKLIKIIENCMDNEKLTEALMSLFDTMDDLLNDYEQRAGLRPGSAKAKSKPKSPRGKGRDAKHSDAKGKAQDESDGSDEEEEEGAILEGFKYDPTEDEEELHRLRREPAAPAQVPAAAAGLQPAGSGAAAAPPAAQGDPFMSGASASSPYRIIEPQRLQALYAMYPPFQPTASPAPYPLSGGSSFPMNYPASAGATAAAAAYPPAGTPLYVYQPAPAAAAGAGGAFAFPSAGQPATAIATATAQNPFYGSGGGYGQQSHAQPSAFDLALLGSAAPTSSTSTSSSTATSSASGGSSDPLLDWLIAPAVRQAAVSAATSTASATSAQHTSPSKTPASSSSSSFSSSSSPLGPPPSSHRARSRSRPGVDI